MLFRSTTTVLALGASAVLASPFQRRQETSVSGSPAVSDTAASTSVAVPTASGSDTTALESATSALGSAVSGVTAAATTTGSAPAATATTEANATSPDAFAFGCPDGSSLTYVVGVAPYPDVDIEQAYSALENWGTAIPPPIMGVSSEGDGEGATRSWMLSAGETNLSVPEVLTRVNETPSTFLEQEWNLTTPITVSPSVVINNYTNVLTLYSNSTDNATSVQLFSNFCVTNQTAGLELFTQLVTVYLTGLTSLFNNATMDMGNMTSTGAVGSASSSASSAVESATSSASSAVEGITGTASSAVSGALETATSGAASVASAGVSGLTSAPGSVATSLVGAVTGAILPSSAA